ncbi:CLUMA_CG004554, isoform A [Clunio marinus]|uniref:CLUMA_CG004554, isoform A n=1 Tax=Clunio marinus TaxID=568069 RepID=A0A1J1HS04_9DIPT|nr:CLUMA_CG004554, isoform A [Clunio marinus]
MYLIIEDLIALDYILKNETLVLTAYSSGEIKVKSASKRFAVGMVWSLSQKRIINTPEKKTR